MKKGLINIAAGNLANTSSAWINLLQQRLFLQLDKKPEMPRKRKSLESIGRISLPVNPATPKQTYQPARMSSRQMEAVTSIAAGTIVFNTCAQLYQRFGAIGWQTITHYPGERLLGGIVTYIDETGSHGLLTSISHQITAVQWNDSFNRIPISLFEENAHLPVDRYQLLILKGNNTSYATRMARHYCVNANGETIRGWRIPSLSELLSILQDPILGASFKSGSAWGFTDKDTIYWLFMLENNPQNQQNPENYYIRLVREF